MTELRREHWMSEHGGVIQDPVPAPIEPRPCRSCHDGHLGVIVDGKAGCNKCGRVHSFIVLKGKVSYGVLL